MAAGAAALTSLAGCEQREAARQGITSQTTNTNTAPRANPNEQYVWVSANANLPLFTLHDHPALHLAAKELGVKGVVAGPNSVNIAGLVSAIEQTAAQKPAGMMVVGWDASALVPAINLAIEQGIPVICVDADVPASKRLCFVGTDWFELGVRQAEAMVKALNGRTGKVALIGLIDQEIDQRAFAGFRTVAAKHHLECLEPQHDKGNTSEATRIASAIIQGTSGLVGIAGFGSESGPGIGQAIKEARQTARVIGTCVDAEPAHLQLLSEGALSACIGQKRELFTYYGLHILFDLVHSPLRLTKDDRRAGIRPVPESINTGTYTVTRENLNIFL
jgi:ABC-type sugar transport system substrate-binding protein